jgi:hypothetical protein
MGAVSFQLGRISMLEPFVKGQYACHKETNKDDSYFEIEKWIENCRQVGLEAQLVTETSASMKLPFNLASNTKRLLILSYRCCLSNSLIQSQGQRAL